MIFPDLKKAFDTMEHAILLYWVRCLSLKWFGPADRAQQTFILVDGAQSDFCIPPLLFTTVNEEEWLGSQANIKDANKDAKI